MRSLTFFTIFQYVLKFVTDVLENISCRTEYPMKVVPSKIELTDRLIG